MPHASAPLLASAAEVTPTAEVTALRWRELAADIWQAAQKPVSVGASRGSLEVIGSGIESVGFTRDAEPLLVAADDVFFCVADPPTQAWIRRLRPDAYDLYVLYDDAKPRYHTYVQMSEAILYAVRAGRRVVAVFYGHPGIFVLSTHRAVRIARREGHRARMRPGVSALDCLCADLGVDPAQPGMQTFEATDMLLRGRRLDTTLHVVLWQVGLVGEMGYRRRGFINRNFDVLVERLRDVYGDEHHVAHYVAARYPTLEPLIAWHPVAELSDPAIRKTFTGISTLYVPPRDAAEADVEVAVRLGLAEPGARPRPAQPLREIDAYGPRERKALESLRDFRVPPDYQFHGLTAACEFLLALVDDTELQELYRFDPEAALDRFPSLSCRERQLLLTRESGAVQLAAKGMVVQESPNERAVLAVTARMSTARSLLDAVVEGTRCGDRRPLNQWQRRMDVDVTWPSFPGAIDDVLASSLAPWTGVYLDEAHQISVALVASGSRRGLLWVAGTPIDAFQFHDHMIAWRDGEVTGDLLMGWDGNRTVTGTFVDGERRQPVDVRAVEPIVAGPPLVSASGRYVGDDGAVEILVSPRAGVAEVVVNGEPAVAAFARGAVRWEGGWLQPLTGSPPRIRGELGTTPFAATADPAFGDTFCGEYFVRRTHDGRASMHRLSIRPGAVELDGRTIAATFRDRRLTCTEGPEFTAALNLFVDPLTGAPALFGTLTDAEGPARVSGVAAGKAAAAEPIWHSGGVSLPEWAVAQLRPIARRWEPRGGLHLYSQWQKTAGTHRVVRKVRASLPRLLRRTS